VKLWRLLSATE